jgi:hypothetical protein
VMVEIGRIAGRRRMVRISEATSPWGTGCGRVMIDIGRMASFVVVRPGGRVEFDGQVGEEPAIVVSGVGVPVP